MPAVVIPLRHAFAAAVPVVALAVASVAVAGCARRPPPTGPSRVTIPALHLTFVAPADLAGLTFAIGRSAQGGQAANFSTRSLTAAGGPGCAAANAYPLGQIVLSRRTPAEVARQKQDRPEETPGELVKRLGSSFLYYSAPPAQSCADDRLVGAVQRRATRALRSALSTVAVDS